MEAFSLSGLFINRFGKTMNHEQFYRFLFREYIDDVKATGFLGQEIHHFSNSMPFKSVEQAKQLQVYASHFSISLYFKETSRLKENIRYMVAIPFDIDWGKRGVKATSSDVWHWIKKNTGIEMSAIWKSRTRWCYHGVLRIEMMVGTPKSIHLLEWLAKELANRIHGDLGGTHSNQWLRIGGFQKFSDKIYNVDELKCFLPSHEELEKRQRERASGVVSLSKYKVENHPAVKKLLGGDVVSWRNHACFTAALMLKVMGYSKGEAFEFLSGDWFRNVNEGWDKPFGLNEVKSCVKSAFSGKYQGPSKEWIFNVTEIEFPYNLSYVRTKYKKSDEVRVAVVNFLRENGTVMMKQEEFAKAIKMPLSSFKKELKWLKNNGIIDYQSKRGGNKQSSNGTTFRLIKDDVFSQNDVLIEEDYGYQALP